MSVEALQAHLERPLGRGSAPAGACTGAAGGAACGDLIRVSLLVDADSPDGHISEVGFDASGCGAAIAAGSATVALVRGAGLFDAARVGAREIAEELGGLSPSKMHAAELAADALHRALGLAARRQATLAPSASRTLVAMSGGVDSAVAALLSSEIAEEVAAVTLELWSDPENDGERSCCSAQAVRSARDIAHQMGLPHLSIDLREEFRAGVVDGWLEDHAAGLTPNPCVRCNGKVRLDAMIELADRLGAQTLATGHYARVLQDGRGGPLLRVAVDEGKDQSYALAALSPSSLARLRFPLGELRKPEVRERAARAGLEVARKPDSQDLCFLAGTRRADFLARHGDLRRRTGPIVDRDGRKLGEHDGVHTLTLGQRHGLGISGSDDPLYVVATDNRTNTVTVGGREELRTTAVRVREVTLHRDAAEVDAVKIRYRGSRMPCRIEQRVPAGTHERIELRTPTEIERTAPGQVACLYAGEAIVGHGTISL
jgi:tRNA-uridine 2-sulfurtransferase